MVYENNYRTDKNKNTVFIDINLNFYREIYNEWDFSPFINRDLDDDLFEYLENSILEIPKNQNVEIVIHIPKKMKNSQKEINCKNGFKNYFDYQIRKVQTSVKDVRKRMMISIFFGAFLVFIDSLLRKHFTDNSYLSILNEGITIGGWFFIWDFFATLSYKQLEVYSRKKNLIRLNSAKISFKYK